MGTSLKNSTVVVDGHHPVHGGASLISWLLGQGAVVTVAGIRADDASVRLQRRVNDVLKRTAPDGKAYNSAVARLSWTRSAPGRAANAYDLLLSGWKKKLIAITGHVGKSTTALWAAHLIGDAVVVGHSPDKPLVSVMNSRARVAIVEADESLAPTSSRHAVYGTDAASVDPLIDGVAFAVQWGEHNIVNASTAVQIARSVGVPVATIQKRLATLPQPPYRQEVAYRDAKLTIVNDALAANPEAGIAAVRRWGGPTTVLVTGGGGAGDYHRWSDEVCARVRGTNVIVLPGTATRAMRLALRRKGYVAPGCDTLERAFGAAFARAATYVSATVLVSPAATHHDHFELGSRLNALIKRELS